MTTFSRRHFAGATLAGAAAVTGLVPARAWAEAFPARQLHYVSPYPPGGTNDLVARIVSRKLAANFSQPVVVDNRSGAGGTIGTQFVVQAAADGYTVLNASSGNLSSAPQVLGAPYDPLADLVPVGFLGHTRFVFAVHPSVPATTLAELIAYAKKNPRKINYGTAGNGTGGHIAGEYLRLRTGIDIVHVPYRGSAPALNDAVAGHVQLVLDPLAAQHVRAGKLRALAYSGATVSPDLPGVPSIEAAGVPGWEATNFFLAAVPAKTSAGVVEQLHRQFVELARDADTVAELKALGVEIQPLSLPQIAALLKAEIDVNNRVIRAAGITA
ncbi:Bug family tripartite tricarboxylate transporter substrate binding protein [Variovorax arabinosiphilus]|uniref:Bug family tripartite tricarboxylate transporter substrate binding protein n=1 Tax=Variovorax arabinosiphilus TaxID=3053498 RepID=UPI002577B5AA|nr:MULTISPECIES: tripartite tricarboxylate transporter substrate binding protein [unclassified Variovorax]MDM0119061.1 tripartite tricarboxylate transporter substrate binding protein [Variovorax sp. J2L1-78]MDM0129487.1 tripartite tricarboxylate transporter substrate binding protein [Variovorax sp. J2L1-63]MDM0232727.1 tripartite tricarboxylate transporter substrate binding protein [Variovorax sp. J2R1-6]